MRRIQRQVSLEEFVSRLPSVVPSYKDNNFYRFDEESLSGRSYEYRSNYGMVPVNVVLNHCPSSSLSSSDYAVVTKCDCYAKCNCDERGEVR